MFNVLQTAKLFLMSRSLTQTWSHCPNYSINSSLEDLSHLRWPVLNQLQSRDSHLLLYCNTRSFCWLMESSPATGCFTVAFHTSFPERQANRSSLQRETNGRFTNKRDKGTVNGSTQAKVCRLLWVRVCVCARQLLHISFVINLPVVLNFICSKQFYLWTDSKKEMQRKR